MEEETREVIQEILMLVEDNLRTSASASGLRKRGDNLRKMEEVLLKLLRISEDDAETLFWKWNKD